MATDTYELNTSRILFTAPWEPVVVRRGDALGLRALADQFADALAPDLSNRVRDGRWVTILAWCLARSHEVFHACGGRAIETRAQQLERYAWLRPLELMWVARTIALAENWRERSLSGQRRVRPWYEVDEQSTRRFGMTGDQFRAYRQTGMYGGYRLAFRKWPSMSVGGDGWTPGSATIKLASWLDKKLGTARPDWNMHLSDGDEGSVSKQSARLNRGNEVEWWLRKWGAFDQRGRDVDEYTLPRARNDFSELPEVALLKPLVFGDDSLGKGKRRLEMAHAVTSAPGNRHLEVCKHLGQVFGHDPVIALLPHFSRLADAGIDAMELVADALREASHVKLADIASLPRAKPICNELVAAAQAWRTGAAIQVHHIDAAHRFASSFVGATPIDCLRALLLHHEVYGGGLRWFVLKDGRVEPRTPPGGRPSRYRFRLWSLCRLATQCGVLRDMPVAILNDDEGDENSQESTDE